MAYNINMTYTDIASIKARLEAPVHLDFSHLSFKYSEFPNGLKVIFYNDRIKKILFMQITEYFIIKQK